MESERDTILEALRVWIDQRPGLEFANYGDATAYRAEQRRIARDRVHARQMLSAVKYSDATVDRIKAGFRAYSGRLTWGGSKLSYVTGQYWPTEYRAAACAVLASILWDQARAAMPKPRGRITVTRGEFTTEHDDIEGMTPGDWLRRHFRKQFGRSIAAVWFN